MFTVDDISTASSVVVTAQGLRRVFSSMFPRSVGGLSLSAFGISSVVYFSSGFGSFIEGFKGSGYAVTLEAIKEANLIVGVISGADGGLTIDEPVFTASHRMQSQLTCVLGEFFHSMVDESSGLGIGGCGIVLGGEVGYSSNLSALSGLNKVGIPSEVLLCYEVFAGGLGWANEAFESTYVHSFRLTLGQKETV